MSFETTTVRLAYNEPCDNDIKTFETRLEDVFKKMAQDINNDGITYDIKGSCFYKTIDLLHENLCDMDKELVKNILIRYISKKLQYNYLFEQDHKLFTYKLILAVSIIPNLQGYWTVRYIEFIIIKDPKYDTSLLLNSTKDNTNCVMC